MNKATIHEAYMKIAIEQAKRSFENDEVPIGCIIVDQNKIIAKGCNACEQNHSQLYHAEMVALNELCKGSLVDPTIYITLEPCPMCLGAIVEMGIKKIVYGASEPRWGSLGGVVNLISKFELEVLGGILQQECAQLMKTFFLNRRKK